MPRHFMLYWKPATVEHHLACDFLLRNAGSSQLARVDPGDTLWIVTTAEGDLLGLAGRLCVGAVVSLAEARRRLGTDDLWPSPFHALARPGSAEPMRGISLEDIAADLKFTGSAIDCLTVARDGSVNPIELKTMLELSPDSAALLERVWLRNSTL